MQIASVWNHTYRQSTVPLNSTTLHVLNLQMGKYYCKCTYALLPQIFQHRLQILEGKMRGRKSVMSPTTEVTYIHVHLHLLLGAWCVCNMVTQFCIYRKMLHYAHNIMCYCTSCQGLRYT